MLYTRTRIVSLLLLVSLAASSGCTTNPATGRTQMRLLSVQEEIALGEQAQPELTREYGGEIPDSVLREYFANIGYELARHTEDRNPELPWEFTLLDSDVINAFALPGGKVFMTRGLMSRMDNEAQVAGVIGHEIGHVTARHINERLSHALGLQASVAIIAGVTRGAEARLAQMIPEIVGVAGQGFLLKFSRDQESEADYLGMRYMSRGGYDPLGQRQVMEVFLAEMGRAPALMEILQTHPYPETRIRRIQELLDTEFRHTQDNPEYRLHEERFQRTAAPRLAALEQRNRLASADAGDAPRGEHLLAQPHLWCAVCAGAR